MIKGKYGLGALFLFVIILALPGCNEKASDISARVVALSGVVEIKNAAADSFVAAKMNDNLGVGGILKTGEAAQASLEIIDRGVVELKSESSFELEPGKDYIVQKAGVAIYKIEKNKEGFKVKSPQAVTCVLGTRFMVRILDGMTVVGVEEGRVSVTTNKGETRIIEAGKKLTVEESGFRGEAASFDLNTDSFNYLQIDGKWVPKE